ncbi:hypothetical protein ABUW04_14060 [Streptacidiphilus sp. N1-10]|uniref:Uncharacterized protein n=1 Tax=Streptacidiphilus jeojiensis TaxID=3229225 RepID=A0ABV6XM89_9ACTN
MPKAEPELAPEAEAQAEPEAEPGPELAPEAEAQAEPEPKPEAKTVPEAEPAAAVATAPAAAADAVAEPAPTVAPEAVAPEAVAPEAVAPPAARKPRRRGKTALIMAVAVVLGVLGGAGVGYAVQQHRAPTPLPPLSVAQPSYPAAHSTAAALTAAQDDMVRTDGDLTKLLVPVPKGAKKNADESGDNGWLALDGLAETYTKPGVEFTWQLDHGFRRAAVVAWDQGGVNYQVNLIQFQHTAEASTAQFLVDQSDYLVTDAGGAKYRTAVPGTVNGAVFAGHKQLHDDGGTYYRGGGLAVHGDIVVAVWVDSSHPIDGKALMAVVQDQLERL